jgi:hypothetical protein
MFTEPVEEASQCDWAVCVTSLPKHKELVQNIAPDSIMLVPISAVVPYPPDFSAAARLPVKVRKGKESSDKGIH